MTDRVSMEPVMWLVRWSAGKGEPANVNPWVAVEVENYLPNPGKDEQPLFTLAQLQQARREALEEAAKAVEDYAEGPYQPARAIRALIQQGEKR